MLCCFFTTQNYGATSLLLETGEAAPWHRMTVCLTHILSARGLVLRQAMGLQAVTAARILAGLGYTLPVLHSVVWASGYMEVRYQ